MNTDVLLNENLVDSDGRREKIFPALSVKNINIEKRQIRVLASSDDLDRHGDRVLPSAFKKRLALFKSNPVILAGHLHRAGDATPTVVGKAVDVWVDGKGLWAVIEFATTPLAEQYWQLYKGGFMRAVSVGFRVIEFRTELEGGRHIDVITEAELLEISLVAVPANPSAIVKGADRKKFFVARKRIEKLTAKRDDSRAAEFAKAFLEGGGDNEIESDFFDTESQESACDVAVSRDFGRFF